MVAGVFSGWYQSTKISKVLVTVFMDYRDLGLQTIPDWIIKLR